MSTAHGKTPNDVRMAQPWLVAALWDVLNLAEKAGRASSAR
jgi:hypothetical protein